MGLVDRVDQRAAGRRKAFAGTGTREDLARTLEAAFSWGSGAYSQEYERIENDFRSYVAGAYKGDGIVFSAIDRRQQVFSQARFMWQRMRNGRPADLFTSADLRLLEQPWPNGTTGELLAHMEFDGSLAGNFYSTTADDWGTVGAEAKKSSSCRIVRMRPDWTRMVIKAPSGNPWALDARVVAYEYQPPAAGAAVRPDPVILLPNEVTHYSPKPDPVARFRGMSWLTPVIKEILADKAATAHKLKFFENGAIHSMALKYPEGTPPELLRQYKRIYDEDYRGVENAYRTLHVAGADPIPVSANLKELDFKSTQGAGETRISAASGVPASILGINEGLQGSTLNAGNFGAARRLFVDTTIRDLWSKAAPSLGVLLTSPGSDTRLWTDDRDIPFLREDAADNAQIRREDAVTIRNLVDAGYHPDAAVEFVRTGDLSVLKGEHSGLFSVQLQKPGAPGAPMPTLGAAA